MRILHNLRFKTSLRDVYLSPKFSHELQDRLPEIKDPPLPQVSRRFPSNEAVAQCLAAKWRILPSSQMGDALPPPPAGSGQLSRSTLPATADTAIAWSDRSCLSKAVTWAVSTRCNSSMREASCQSCFRGCRASTQPKRARVAPDKRLCHAGGARATNGAFTTASMTTLSITCVVSSQCAVLAGIAAALLFSTPCGAPSAPRDGLAALSRFL